MSILDRVTDVRYFVRQLQLMIMRNKGVNQRCIINVNNEVCEVDFPMPNDFPDTIKNYNQFHAQKHSAVCFGNGMGEIVNEDTIFHFIHD